MPHFTYWISASNRRAGATGLTHGVDMLLWNVIYFQTLLICFYLMKHNKAFPISRANVNYNAILSGERLPFLNFCTFASGLYTGRARCWICFFHPKSNS
jgi:hypothetical protein